MKWMIKIGMMAFAFCLAGCAEQDIVSSFEEVKETVAPVPISFSPYYASSHEINAETRANTNYLSHYDFDKGNFRFLDIPFLGEQRNGYNRIGHAAYNNYIVGVYGFWHQGSDWDTDKESNDLEADFMTNQPLLHLWKDNTVTAYWTYTPLKYWPNNDANGGSNGYSDATDKVTFVSYFPYQDYEGGPYYKDGTGESNTDPISTLNSGGGVKIDGVYYYTFDATDANITKTNADLRCITPPAKNAKGKAAYTFGFDQKDAIAEHIDFMLGINEDVTKQSIVSSVKLKLRHALCAVKMEVAYNPLLDAPGDVYVQQAPDRVEWTVNSMILTGMYDKGTVTPYLDT